jgi:NTE family protein
MEIALALGGGGVKGWAHIGVIKCLIDNGFQIGSISGTSAGAMVGAMYAAGYTSAQIIDIFNNIRNSPKIYHRCSNDEPSLLGLKGFSDIFEEELGHKSFEDLEIPFACTAVDINTGQEIIINRGKLSDAILAAIAVPGIFPPRQFGNYLLADGGVVDPVPVALARWLSPKLPVVAVCLTPKPEKWSGIHPFQLPIQAHIPQPIIEQFSRIRIGQSLKIFMRAIEITTLTVAELRLITDVPDVIIRPEVNEYGMFDEVEEEKLIHIGEEAAEKTLGEIKKGLSWTGTISRLFRQSSLPHNALPIEKENH